MTDKTILTGGCLCGNVKYRVEGKPFGAEYCHCSMCRKSVGSATVNWMDFKIGQVTWLVEQPKVFASSEHTRRGFCPECGGSMTFSDTRHPEYLSLTMGTLDDPDLVKPTIHIYAEDQIGWLNIVDECKRFAKGATKD